MKTRTLTIAVVALAACSDPQPPAGPEIEARLRNNLPAACTMQEIAACPPMNVTACPDGREPVIDYSGDCCGHFSCQLLCESALRNTCPMTPAPTCQPGTKLWIGTAVEDCCPAYRCQPDSSQCDPSRETCACDAMNAACTLALPYCGPNVMPIVVGQTPGCCPIYQCPCEPMKATDANGAMADPATGLVPNPSCGCTFPSCKAGEEIVCAGTDRCGGPCECKPAHGTCRSNAECSADARCDVSTCRLPPSATALVAPPQTCDAAKCGPRPALPNTTCPDNMTIAGPTGRCLVQADGSCGWEIRECPSTMPQPECYGICVPNIQRGCRADTDCPSDQICDVKCTGWGCSSGNTPTNTDPATGTTPALVPPSTCACDLNDPSCMCDAAGNCRGQTCEGMCVKKPGPVCDPARLIACPMTTQACPNGAPPIQTGVSPDTCCPIYTCPVCSRPTPANGSTDLVAPTSCLTPRCACAKQTGTDPMTCCPTYECGPVNADGSCAR